MCSREQGHCGWAFAQRLDSHVPITEHRGSGQAVAGTVPMVMTSMPYVVESWGICTSTP